MNPFSTATGLARIAATASWRTASWSARTAAHATSAVVGAAASGQSAGAALDQVAGEAADSLRRVLGVRPAGGDTAADSDVPLSSVIAERVERAPRPASSTRDGREAGPSLPEMYGALLDASTEVATRPESHPAYVRLMQELSPDEARILRLFARSGAQSALDVRTSGTFGFGSKLVAPGVTMIGQHAGCADLERVPAYLNNLNRLGLIWFSREMIGDVNSYALLEAQPEVMHVAEELGGKSKVKTVLRSIELTAFGKNFCATCGLMDAAEIAARASEGEVTQALPPPDGR
jgi:hypothetical protein